MFSVLKGGGGGGGDREKSLYTSSFFWGGVRMRHSSTEYNVYNYKYERIITRKTEQICLRSYFLTIYK